MLANAGHFDVEIDLDGRCARLAGGGARCCRWSSSTTLGDGRRLNLLAQRPRGEPRRRARATRPAVMDMSFAIQALAVEHLVRHAGELEPRVLDVPREIDDEVARLKLDSLGVEIDSLDRGAAQLHALLEALTLGRRSEQARDGTARSRRSARCPAPQRSTSLPVAIEQVLVEVPVRLAEFREQRMLVLARDLRLREHRELDAVVGPAELADLLLRARLLAGEVVGGEAQHHEPVAPGTRRRGSAGPSNCGVNPHSVAVFTTSTTLPLYRDRSSSRRSRRVICVAQRAVRVSRVRRCAASSRAAARPARRAGSRLLLAAGGEDRRGREGRGEGGSGAFRRSLRAPCADGSAGAGVDRVVEPLLAHRRRRGRRRPGRGGCPSRSATRARPRPRARQRSAHSAMSASAAPVPRASGATNRSFITPIRAALRVDQVQKIVAKPEHPARPRRARRSWIPSRSGSAISARESASRSSSDGATS